VYRAGNGAVAVQSLHFQANESDELLSDEAVESIGREDYVRVVACLGQPVTNNDFEDGIGLA
jgi:hypothetical protein